jgi:hypothetical protein
MGRNVIGYELILPNFVVIFIFHDSKWYKEKSMYKNKKMDPPKGKIKTQMRCSECE